MPVLHRRGDDARRGRGQERLDEAAVGLVENGAEVHALGVDVVRIQVAHRADRLGRLEVADGAAAGHLLLAHALEDRVAHDVPARPPSRGAAEAAHPMLDVEEEALALLLAVVADVDPGGDLPGHDPAQRRVPGRRKLVGIHRLAPGAAGIEPDQLRRPRQAAGMGRQDPILAPAHGSSSPSIHCIASHAPSSGTDAARAARTNCWSRVASGAPIRPASSRYAAS